MSPAPAESVVLVTSIGSEAGRELVECLAPVRPRLRVIATNLLADAPGLFFCDAAYLVPPTAELSLFRPRLEEILAKESPRLVFAARDEDLGVLAAMAESGNHPGVQFLVPPAALVPVCNDKYATHGFARRHGLPFAESAITADEVRALVERRGLPIIAKPRRLGHGSKGVYVMTGAEQVRTALAIGGFIFQEVLAPESLMESTAGWRPELGIPMIWALEDEGVTANLAIGRDGRVLRMMLAKIRRKGPAMSRYRADEDPAVGTVAMAYAEALAAEGYRGSLNIQGKMVPGRGFVVYEINGRVAGAATSRALAGFNLPLTLVCHYLWGETALPDQAPVPVCETPEVCRQLGSLPVPRQAMETLRREGRWSRDGR